MGFFRAEAGLFEQLVHGSVRVLARDRHAGRVGRIAEFVDLREIRLHEKADDLRDFLIAERLRIHD